MKHWLLINIRSVYFLVVKTPLRIYSLLRMLYWYETFFVNNWKIMNVDFEFHLNQMKFIGSRILDVSLHKGGCLSMCIDFIDRRRKKLPCNFIYFSQLYRFASYQRALSYGAEAGKIQDAVLSPNGRFRICLLYTSPSPRD